MAREIPDRKLYQDEIYGTKELSPLAIALIDTPEVQRLSHIYQLGFTYSIFRGANHRRFDHSVGTYFMARTLMRRIVQNHARLYSTNPDAFWHPGQKLSPRVYIDAAGTAPGKAGLYSPMGRWRGLTEVVSAAALLHDIGHVPVGHTLEDEFSVLEKHDRLGGPRLFEMLYGPRTLADSPETRRAPTIRDFFSAIDGTILPRPESWERVPLPWVFEDETYERFLPEPERVEANGDAVSGLANWEIRDLIYLILSFKETIKDRTYITFRQELAKAQVEAEKSGDPSWGQRLKFLWTLYEYHSAPADTGPTHEALPLFYPFMADVVGNIICADLLDYLIRDGKRLKLDIRDNSRLQRYLVVRPASSFVGETESLRLTIYAVHRNGLRRRDTVSDLLDLMRERHRFSEVVYYHQKKAAFSTMLAKALELLPDEAKPRDGAGIYPAPWSKAENTAVPPHMVHFGDDTLLAYVARAAEDGARANGGLQTKSMAAEMIRNIYYRNEYRKLFTLDYDAASTVGNPTKFIEDLRSQQGAARDSGRRRTEEQLARIVERCGAGTWKYDKNAPILIYCPNIRMQAKEVAAHVEFVVNRVTPLNLQEDDPGLLGEIDLLNAKYQRLWRLYLFMHPRLSDVGKDDPERQMLLSTIVDAFCHKYGVREDDRRKGCSFRYIPWTIRVRTYFDQWQRNLPYDFPCEDIRRRSEEHDLWLQVVGADYPPFPAGYPEYENGFALAMALVAADGSPARDRGQWAVDIQPFKGPQWLRRAPRERTEQARVAAVSSMAKLAAAVKEVGGEARQAFNDWETFRKYVSTELSRARLRS